MLAILHTLCVTISRQQVRLFLRKLYRSVWINTIFQQPFYPLILMFINVVLSRFMQQLLGLGIAMVWTWYSLGAAKVCFLLLLYLYNYVLVELIEILLSMISD